MFYEKALEQLHCMYNNNLLSGSLFQCALYLEMKREKPFVDTCCALWFEKHGNRLTVW